MREVLPGVTAGDDVVLTDAMVAWLRELRARVPAAVPLHVTSGVRTAAAQAAAMLSKLSQGDDLMALYRDDGKIARLLTLPADPQAWAAQIQQWVDEGSYLSRHLTGRALDLRIRDLDEGQIALVTSSAKELGARVLREGTPPHLHLDVPVERPTASTSPGGGVSRAASVAVPLLLLGLAGAGVATWWTWPWLAGVAGRVAPALARWA